MSRDIHLSAMSRNRTVDHTYVTMPISFLAAVQIGLFRNVGDLAYLPVATTGNLMRFVTSLTAKAASFFSRRVGVKGQPSP